MLASLVGLCVGTYAWLDASVPPLLGAPLLALGVLLAVAAAMLSGRRVNRTRYRPDPWAGAEWVVSACGVLGALGMFLAASLDPLGVNPSPTVLTLPQLPPVAFVAVLVGALPSVLAPPMLRPSGEPGGPS